EWISQPDVPLLGCLRGGVRARRPVPGLDQRPGVQWPGFGPGHWTSSWACLLTGQRQTPHRTRRKSLSTGLRSSMPAYAPAAISRAPREVVPVTQTTRALGHRVRERDRGYILAPVTG